MGNSELQTLDYSTLKHLPISLPYYSGSVCTHGDKELLPEPRSHSRAPTNNDTIPFYAFITTLEFSHSEPWAGVAHLC